MPTDAATHPLEEFSPDWQAGGLITIIWHIQPIVTLNDEASIVGYELLTRPHHASPPDLWIWARSHGWVESLEQRTYAAALELRPQILGRLFLNVDPCMLQEAAPNTAPWEQLHPIAIEVTENALPMIHSLNQARSVGLDIAIDDWGVGEGMIEKLTDWSATWLKLDRSVVMRAPHSRAYREFLLYILEFARDHNISTIAEGIETVEELATMSNLGVQYGQGYYWGQPQPILKGTWRVPSQEGSSASG